MHLFFVSLNSFPLVISRTVCVDRASMLLCSALLYLVHVLTLPYSHGMLSVASNLR